LPTDSTPLNSISRLFKPDPSRDYFRVLADTLPEAVLVISKNGDQLLAHNHAFLLLSGYARTDLDTLTGTDLFPSEPGEQALANITEAWEGPELCLQSVPLKTRQGETQPVNLRVRPIPPNRSAFLILFESIDVQAQDQKSREPQFQHFDSIAQMSALILDGTVAAIPSVLELAAKLLRASYVGLYRVSPTAPEYILSGSLPSPFPKSLPAAELGPLQRNASWSRGQSPEHQLHKAARETGSALLLTTLTGSPTAWIGVLVSGWRDPKAIPSDAEPVMRSIARLCHIAVLLGLQKATAADTEKKLTEVQAEGQGLYMGITDTLLSLSDDLRVVRVNPAITELLGYQPEEVEGLAIKDVLVGPEDVRPALLDALDHDRVAEQTRIILHRRDGRPIPVHLRAVPMDPDSPSRLLVILKDQSKQQAIEDQSERLAQRALLGEVTAIFAHEVRNPINNISTGVQLVASRLGMDHNLYDSLKQVQKECNRLDQLMSDVLFFSKSLELRMKPLNLASQIERILARWEPRFNQGNVVCHTEFDPKTPHALADLRTLERVIVNLISNALEAMEEGGTLSFSLSPVETAQGIMVELKVADTGPGIPPDVAARIFDPFYTTKKDGTGLGLAISRRIMLAHKGQIQVKSFAGAGTVFTINIPAAKPTEN
jgi:PAS domain S-box-containing protein